MPLQQTNAYMKYKYSIYIYIYLSTYGKLFEHTQVGVLAITFRKSNHVQTRRLDLLLALDPGYLEAEKQKINHIYKKLPFSFKKNRIIDRNFAVSGKNTNRINMQYVVSKLCFRAPVLCMFHEIHTCTHTHGHTHTHATKRPAKRLSCRIEFGPGPLPKERNATPNTAIDTGSLSSGGANYFIN